MVLVSIYILEAIKEPSDIIKLLKGFARLVIILTIIASVKYITAILRSSKENIP
jgi:hypothetical protein